MSDDMASMSEPLKQTAKWTISLHIESNDGECPGTTASFSTTGSWSNDCDQIGVRRCIAQEMGVALRSVSNYLVGCEGDEIGADFAEGFSEV